MDTLPLKCSLQFAQKNVELSEVPPKGAVAGLSFSHLGHARVGRP